eukprot:6746536-Karenia_brevis.AAC.1
MGEGASLPQWGVSQKVERQQCDRGYQLQRSNFGGAGSSSSESWSQQKSMQMDSAKAVDQQQFDEEEEATDEGQVLAKRMDEMQARAMKVQTEMEILTRQLTQKAKSANLNEVVLALKAFSSSSACRFFDEAPPPTAEEERPRADLTEKVSC